MKLYAHKANKAPISKSSICTDTFYVRHPSADHGLKALQRKPKHLKPKHNMTTETIALMDQVKEIVLNKESDNPLLSYVKTKLGERFDDYNEHLVLYIEDGDQITPLGFSPIRKKVLPIPLSFAAYLKSMPQLNYEHVLIALTTYLQFSYKSFYNIFEQRKHLSGTAFDVIDEILAPTYSYILFDEQLEKIYSLLTGASKSEAIQFRKDINYRIRTAANNSDLKQAKEMAIQHASSISLLPGFSVYDLLSKHNWYFYLISHYEDHASAFLLYRFLRPKEPQPLRNRLGQEIIQSYRWDESLFDNIKQAIFKRADSGRLVDYLKQQLAETFDDYEEHLVLYIEQGAEKIPLKFISSTDKMTLPEITFAQYLKRHYQEDYQSVLNALSCYTQFDEQNPVRFLMHKNFKKIGVPFEAIDRLLSSTNGYIIYKDQLEWIYRFLTGGDQDSAIRFCRLHNRKSAEAIRAAKNIYLMPNFSLNNLLEWRCWDPHHFVYSAAYHPAWIIHNHLQQRKLTAALDLAVNR